MKGCYAGREGTWLILGLDENGSFTLSKSNATSVWDKGKFDPYSKTCYYNK
jgi:hypothetical protein